MYMGQRVSQPCTKPQLGATYTSHHSITEVRIQNPPQGYMPFNSTRGGLGILSFHAAQMLTVIAAASTTVLWGWVAADGYRTTVQKRVRITEVREAQLGSCASGVT